MGIYISWILLFSFLVTHLVIGYLTLLCKRGQPFPYFTLVKRSNPSGLLVITLLTLLLEAGYLAVLMAEMIRADFIYPIWQPISYLFGMIFLIIIISTSSAILNAAVLASIPRKVLGKRALPMQLCRKAMLLRLGLVGTTLLLSKLQEWPVLSFSLNIINVVGLVALSLLVLPVIMISFGFKRSNTAFWASIGAQLLGIGLFFTTNDHYLLPFLSFSTHYIENLSSFPYHGVFLPLMLLGLFSLLFAHYNHYGTFVWEPTTKPNKPSTFDLSSSDDHSLFRNPLKWAQHIFAHATLSPFLLGLALLISRFVPNLVAPTIRESYSAYFFIIRSITLLSSLGLIVYGSVRSYLKDYAPLYWLFAIGWAIVFDPLLEFCYNLQNPIALLNLLFGGLLLLMLVDQRSWLIIIGLFGGAAILFFRQTYEQAHWAKEIANIDLLWTIGLSFLHTLILGVLFIMSKGKDSDRKVLRYKLWAQSISQETDNAFEELLWGLDSINKQSIAYQLKRLKEVKNTLSGDSALVKQQKIKVLIDKVNTIQQALVTNMKETRLAIKEGSNHAIMLHRLMVEDALLSREILPVPVSSLISKACATFSSKYPITFKVRSEAKSIVAVSPILVISVLKHIIRNAISHGEATEVTIAWNDELGTITIADNGRGIPSTILPYIFAFGFSSASGSRGIGLTYSKVVMEGIGGSIAIDTSPKGTTVKLILPKYQR